MRPLTAVPLEGVVITETDATLFLGLIAEKVTELEGEFLTGRYRLAAIRIQDAIAKSTTGADRNDHIVCNGVAGKMLSSERERLDRMASSSDSKVFCQVKGHDFEDANNCGFCAKDSVSISRECAESLLAVLDKGESVYADPDGATKLFGELKQALSKLPAKGQGS
jgi:hypothetical protein